MTNKVHVHTYRELKKLYFDYHLKRTFSGTLQVWIRVLLSKTFIVWELQNEEMSCIVRKPTVCICKKKDADELRSNCEADQHLCFRYTDSTIPLLSKSKISSL